jgi:uncharacterized protein (TIGR02147 family)
MGLAQKIAHSLDLKGRALSYFEMIVINGSSKSEVERRVFEEMLNKLRPKKFRKTTDVSMEVFTATADWYHWAIYALVDLPDFQNDVNWIQQRLGNEIDKKTIRSAIERMLRLGLLIQSDEGRLTNVDPDGTPLELDLGVPSSAVRQYHAQMIERAKASIEQQSMEERQLSATTLAFNPASLSKVAEIIAEAHRQIAGLADQAPAEEVYQFNTQFFRLTNRKMENTQ